MLRFSKNNTKMFIAIRIEGELERTPTYVSKYLLHVCCVFSVCKNQVLKFNKNVLNHIHAIIPQLRAFIRSTSISGNCYTIPGYIQISCFHLSGRSLTFPL